MRSYNSSLEKYEEGLYRYIESGIKTPGLANCKHGPISRKVSISYYLSGLGGTGIIELTIVSRL
jgi:hypothetical protein